MDEEEGSSRAQEEHLLGAVGGWSTVWHYKPLPGTATADAPHCEWLPPLLAFLVYMLSLGVRTTAWGISAKILVPRVRIKVSLRTF